MLCLVIILHFETKKLVTPVLMFHQLQKKSNQPVEIAFITFVGRFKWCQIKFSIIIFPEAVAPHERNNLKNVHFAKTLETTIAHHVLVGWRGKVARRRRMCCDLQHRIVEISTR